MALLSWCLLPSSSMWTRLVCSKPQVADPQRQAWLPSLSTAIKCNKCCWRLPPANGMWTWFIFASLWQHRCCPFAAVVSFKVHAEAKLVQQSSACDIPAACGHGWVRNLVLRVVLLLVRWLLLAVSLGQVQ